MNARLDGAPVDLLFDPSQPPIHTLDDPRLPTIIDLAQRMEVSPEHPCYPTFRRLRAWGALLNGKPGLYQHLRQQRGEVRSVHEWLDMAAEFLERNAA